MLSHSDIPIFVHLSPSQEAKEVNLPLVPLPRLPRPRLSVDPLPVPPRSLCFLPSFSILTYILLIFSHLAVCPRPGPPSSSPVSIVLLLFFLRPYLLCSLQTERSALSQSNPLVQAVDKRG
ncbi:hypothetical protein B0H14DRAFT_3500048 [Mycena olivaceomarginata]|nr:hypothetical protein B0H14DRAFT_3500048 [Mycena olivaceomarginata]